MITLHMNNTVCLLFKISEKAESNCRQALYPILSIFCKFSVKIAKRTFFCKEYRVAALLNGTLLLHK